MNDIVVKCGGKPIDNFKTLLTFIATKEGGDKLKLKILNEVMRIDENEPGSKTAKYFQKTNDGKLILRTVMERYIPRDITNGIKQGFSAPEPGQAPWWRS